MFYLCHLKVQGDYVYQLSIKKPTTRVGLWLFEGDTGCSLKILDEKKQETFLTASFEICNDAKITKWNIYKFTYKVFEVADCDECEGSQDCFSKCKKTRKEEQIDSAELVK